MKTTDELAHEIQAATDILDYLADNRQEMQLDSQETQTLLKQAGYRELYPRDPNELLYDRNIEVLE